MCVALPTESPDLILSSQGDRLTCHLGTVSAGGGGAQLVLPHKHYHCFLKVKYYLDSSHLLLMPHHFRPREGRGDCNPTLTLLLPDKLQLHTTPVITLQFLTKFYLGHNHLIVRLTRLPTINLQNFDERQKIKKTKSRVGSNQTGTIHQKLPKVEKWKSGL